MKQTFDQYLQRLKDRRTEDNYKYTDEDFKKYIYYIFDCYEKDLSVYKCLEFMYFAEREPIQELGIPEVPITIYKETLEEAAEKEFPLVDTEWCRTGAAEEENLHLLGHRKSFIKGAKWQQEQDNKMYSEEEVYQLLYDLSGQVLDNKVSTPKLLDKWFEEFKKK